MTIGLAYRYVFSGPKWGMNLLLWSVCALIPIIGPIVLQGFGTEVMALLVTGRREQCPEFTFDRFSQYLSKGVMPFLVGLVVGLVTMGVAMAAMSVIGFAVVGTVFALLAAKVSDQMMMCVMIPVGCLGCVGYTAMLLTASLVATPFTLRALLTQDFTSSLDIAFARDFLRRTWGPVLVKNLIIVGHFVIIMILAYGTLGLGFVLIYPAVAVIMALQWYFLAELYEIYLQRGGTPIPLKEPPVAPQYGVEGPAFEVGRKA